MNIAIIGCGLIGQKRAKMLGNCKLVACVDTVQEKAEILAKKYLNCAASTEWHNIVDRDDIDIVIVATPHAALPKIGLAVLNAGKHVLIEKPAGRYASELDLLITATKKTGALARVGFNHRYHRAFRKAYELVSAGALGELMFIRGRYGHGGRIGYDKEWRAQPEISGGGELIDQGIHLIDLARWFLGEFTQVHGFAHTYFWNMPVDDNGFMLLKTKNKKVAHLHVSCTEWKNIFSFEIYGKNGKLEVNGLGGSYGVERISFYKMSAAMEPPETFIWEYPMEDDSLEVELNEFIEDIQKNRQPRANLQDAQAALMIIEDIYKISSL